MLSRQSSNSLLMSLSSERASSISALARIALLTAADHRALRLPRLRMRSALSSLAISPGARSRNGFSFADRLLGLLASRFLPVCFACFVFMFSNPWSEIVSPPDSARHRDLARFLVGVYELFARHSRP